MNGPMREENCGPRTKYRHTAKVYNSAIICWLVAISVTIGNTFYELNCWGEIHPGSALIGPAPTLLYSHWSRAS